MIVNHQDGKHPIAVRARQKAIPASRDRMQSEVLVGAIGLLLVAKAVLEIVRMNRYCAFPRWFWIALGVSLGFATLVWLLKSATGVAAAMGGLVCLHVLLRQQLGGGWNATAMPSLVALFVLTFAATHFGRTRKEAAGLAEGRRGRGAAQVAANLGVAGLLAAGGTAGSAISLAMLAACIAALAEATADTVSSEVGQALAGGTILITTGRGVPAGTDGGISVAGTLCGAAAAAVVIAVSPSVHDWHTALAIFGAACVGLLMDSLLGATVERKGWLGNDLVNISSTVFAAAVAWGLLAL